MVDNTIALNFEIEKGESKNLSYFSARIRLSDDSKHLLREKFGSTIQFDNLDNYFDLNPENFYIYYNKYSEHDGRSELYIKSNDGRYLTSSLPLSHYGFSIELSSDGGSIVDYGFYPLAVIYNSRCYDKVKEKVFDDYGELSLIASNLLDTFLSNINGLTTQDLFLQMNNEIAEKEARLVKEKRQIEEELGRRNEELRDLVEKGEIILFKVIKGHNIGDKRSAVILQLDQKGDYKVNLDPSKYYIEEDEYGEYLSSCHDYVDIYYYGNLFFIFNKSSHSGFESGFYSADSADPYNYAKYLREPYLKGDWLYEELSNKLEKGSDQIGNEFATESVDNERMKGKIMVKNETEFIEKREIEDNEDEIGDLENVQVKSKDVEELFSNEGSEQEEIIMTGIMNNIKNNKEGYYLQYPLKIKKGNSIGLDKYKVELNVTYDDMINFWNAINDKYAAKEYDYEQAMILYNKVYIPVSKQCKKFITLAESYIKNDHLFVQDKNFGTITDFNEMFYRGDELV